MDAQLSLLDAIEARNASIQIAVDHADDETPGWSTDAYRMLMRYATSASTFKAEDVRAWAEARGLPAPPDPRAWGGVLQRAARSKQIERIGFGVSTNKQAHCRPTAIWRSLP